MFESRKDSVNNRLHTLRGEQFRHSQNLLRSRSHITSTSGTHLRSLPTNLFEHSDHGPSNSDPSAGPVTAVSSSPLSCSGPVPPKSWIQTSKVSYKATSTWRRQVLSLIFEHPKPVKQDSSTQLPSLSILCFQQLLLACTAAEFKDIVVPFIPSHLRRRLIRYASVESPLSNSKLYALFEPDGHADGEIIIVGPKASLLDGYFLHGRMDKVEDVNRQLCDWDDEIVVPKPLESLVLMSISIPVTTPSTLPPTLTHLALIDIPHFVPLHRLSSVCPLLEVLDISYNDWLTNCSKDTLKSLDRIEWTRWTHMRILGIRNCQLPVEILQRVNKNRWEDVVIVQ